MTRKEEPARKGYGNIYTPHAGSMIIEVQREGGLANRTIVLSERKVRWLRLLSSRLGRVFIAVLALSWLYFAIQAARVSVLTDRLTAMDANTLRLDTLRSALQELQQRYQQVSNMLGATSSTDALLLTSRDSSVLSTPSVWPLASGFVTRGTGGADDYGKPHPGVDIAVPIGTEIRAAGGGLVVEVGDNADYGNFIRVQHDGHYETLYGHASRSLVRAGDLVKQGQVIALSGNTGRSTAPHLHFEMRQNGKAVDPMQLIKPKG